MQTISLSPGTHLSSCLCGEALNALSWGMGDSSLWDGSRLKGAGHGEGWVWLAEGFFWGCLRGIFGISVVLWGGWWLYLKAEGGKQGVAPKQLMVWKVLSLPSGWRGLMGCAAGCGWPGAPSTEALIVWLQL